jgi:type III restriction enzyme
MKDPNSFKILLEESVRTLYNDAPIIGDPDLLDFNQTGSDRRSARGA